jgi:hypothetical protein
MTLDAGSLLYNRYRVLAELGRGGMGVVYHARDENLGVDVAIKGNLFVSPQFAQQFRREATLLAGLRHPNLPRVTNHFAMPVARTNPAVPLSATVAPITPPVPSATPAPTSTWPGPTPAARIRLSACLAAPTIRPGRPVASPSSIQSVIARKSTAKSDGSDTKDISCAHAGDSQPSWSPDGKRLGFANLSRCGRPTIYWCSPMAASGPVDR